MLIAAATKLHQATPATTLGSGNMWKLKIRSTPRPKVTWISTWDLTCALLSLLLVHSAFYVKCPCQVKVSRFCVSTFSSAWSSLLHASSPPWFASLGQTPDLTSRLPDWSVQAYNSPMYPGHSRTSCQASGHRSIICQTRKCVRKYARINVTWNSDNMSEHMSEQIS